MSRNCIKSLLVILVVFLSTLPAYAFTDNEIDALLAPIALYPDPLLAQMLPASTYPGEVADAAAWLRGGGQISQIDQQNWAESVKAIARYPDVLYTMADNMVWTSDLGDAFLNQPEDVTKSIQRLRWQARDAGNLVSNNDQGVITDGDDIQIEPAQPQYMYVPQYDPAFVYTQRWTPGMVPFITFGVGLAIGDWLGLDFDWRNHHVFYHGWNRPGWVDHSRPYVHITNVYVNNSRPYLNQTWRHDPAHGDPERFVAQHSIPMNRGNIHPFEVRGRGTTTPATPSGGAFGMSGSAADVRTFSIRGRESLGTAQPHAAQPPAAISRRPETQPPVAATPRATPPREPSGVFGGYRGANEARTESMRGQASRQSSAPARPAAAPAGRGGRK